MILSNKTLEKLRNIINEESAYRTGPQLVNFFNDLGFCDFYERGFPSRKQYTDSRLEKINGSPEIDKCIKKVFNPQNFIEEYEKLKTLIEIFNKYLAYDEWKIVWQSKEIKILKSDNIDFSTSKKTDPDLDSFLNKKFEDVDLRKLKLESRLIEVLNTRLNEIKVNLENKAPLSVIFLAGSTLEGILLGVATQNPKKYNSSNVAPKKDGKVKKFNKWTLSNFIDVSYDIKYLNLDVKKYSHSLRDFRNYIHPYQQMLYDFAPTMETAEISFQVLMMAISELIKNIN